MYMKSSARSNFPPFFHSVITLSLYSPTFSKTEVSPSIRRHSSKLSKHVVRNPYTLRHDHPPPPNPSLSRPTNRLRQLLPSPLPLLPELRQQQSSNQPPIPWQRTLLASTKCHTTSSTTTTTILYLVLLLQLHLVPPNRRFPLPHSLRPKPIHLHTSILPINRNHDHYPGRCASELPGLVPSNIYVLPRNPRYALLLRQDRISFLGMPEYAELCVR